MTEPIFSAFDKHNKSLQFIIELEENNKLNFFRYYSTSKKFLQVNNK